MLRTASLHRLSLLGGRQELLNKCKVGPQHEHDCVGPRAQRVDAHAAPIAPAVPQRLP